MKHVPYSINFMVKQLRFEEVGEAEIEEIVEVTKIYLDVPDLK